MKKKIFVLTLVLCLLVTMGLTGCGSKEGKVTVGEYKGLTLTSVTQEEVDAAGKALDDAVAALEEKNEVVRLYGKGR